MEEGMEIGTKAKLFLGDVEIGDVQSWSLGNFPFPELETVTFTGIYDPNSDVLKKYLDEKKPSEITAYLYNSIGEKREAKMKIEYKNDEISLEPIEDSIKKWIRDCILKMAD